MANRNDELVLLSQELIELGRHLFRAVTRRDLPDAPGEEHAGHKQRNGQWRVLGILQGRGPQTMNDLANRMDVAPPTVTGIVRGLVERGLVERGHDPDDWRVVRITLTPDGKIAFDKHKENRRQMMVRVIEELDDADIERLVNAIPAFKSLEQLLDPASRPEGEPARACHS